MRKLDRLIQNFMQTCVRNEFELFLSPETEPMKDLSRIGNDVVFFQARNGQLFKLRNDYTASIVEFFNRNVPDSLRVWYSGFVYRYDPLGQIQSVYQLGIEKIPYVSFEDNLVVLKMLVESILSSLTDEVLVEIGDSRVIERCVRHVPRSFRKKLFELIDRKDISELELFASLNGLDLSEVLKLVEASFTKRSVDQLKYFELEPSIGEEIVEVVDFLSNFPGVRVEVDFSIARTVEEYDGLTFTIFDLREPALIAAGGRYSVNEKVLGVGGTIFLEERAWSR
ncbi:ATP phosphoribosyltransferase regulatory subunit [Thermotoga caldifontis]|uniref:ATP phosphoribosyltransferase regulatory subunit n=1 Tax=Thermotoga caldifontis TaxID=1508419 RepID=UPI0006947AD8|nr:ATP phosphoribosyltransferase regulatory subunit [Thermotoga caldifontis]